MKLKKEGFKVDIIKRLFEIRIIGLKAMHFDGKDGKNKLAYYSWQ
jgi:hypothetical protein